jgi:hypothetical protein
MYGCTGKMTKINLNVTVAATETVTSEMVGKVWAEISYWLHITCVTKEYIYKFTDKNF